jgi:hemerythrin-like domain-containing protein
MDILINMKATKQLKDEHEGVKIMLGILEQVCHRLETKGILSKEHFEGILEFLRVFVDTCHHGKEEQLLFPALEGAGVPKEGPVTTALHQHELGRNYVEAMNNAFSAFITGDGSSSQDILQNAQDYISLLKDHIEMENNVLFVAADNRLSEQKQNELFEGFEKIEVDRIGVGKHEEFHGLLKKLSAIYIDRLQGVE